MDLTIERAEILIKHYEKEMEYQKDRINELETCLEMCRDELRILKGSNRYRIEADEDEENKD